MSKFIWVMLSCTIISCGGSGGSDGTYSNSTTPVIPSWKQGTILAGGSQSSGVYLNVDNLRDQQYSSKCDASLGCVAAVVGITTTNSGSTFNKYANYQVNTANIGDVPLTTMVFDTVYDYTVVQLTRTGSTVVGTPERKSENVLLKFDPNTGKIIGKSLSFVVDGKVDGNVISGDVALKQISGTFEGAIGSNGVIGSFAGGDSVPYAEYSRGTIYAGGFIGKPQ